MWGRSSKIHSNSTIFKTLDKIAAYKLYKLHSYLTDDEGSCLEILGLPELADIGAKRCFDKSETRCLDSPHRFVKKVMSEILAMHETAGDLTF
ncbi:family 20 glycosylhydrolase [Vibrio maritimus]